MWDLKCNLSETRINDYSQSVDQRRRTKEGHVVPLALYLHLYLSLCICAHMQFRLLCACCVEILNLHYVLCTLCKFRFTLHSQYCVRVGGGDSPTACCSCCLDGVDSETTGNVPQHLHCLLVRFVVILHEGKMTSSTAPKTEPTKILCRVCVF